MLLGPSSPTHRRLPLSKGPSRSWRASAAALGFLAVTFAASGARADGRFPTASQIAFDPHDGNSVVARTTFGLVVSRDAGTSWRWVCDAAIGKSGEEDPSYVVTAKGTIVAATNNGASVSRDGGCSWSFAPAPKENVFVAMTTRTNGEILGLASTADRTTGGTTTYKNGVFVSKDDAATFASTGAMLDASIGLESIAVAPGDAKRIYVSGARDVGGGRKCAVLVSTDGGASFVEHPVVLEAGETWASIVGVDPQKPERLYLRTTGSLDGAARLLVSDDAGEKFKAVWSSATPLTGFALDAEGKRLFVGGKGGILTATSDALRFGKTADVAAQCLAMAGTVLWTCAPDKDGFLVGASTDGVKFGSKLRLEKLAGPLACPADTTVTRECTKAWSELRATLGIEGEAEKAPKPSGPSLKGRGERTRRGTSPSGIAFIVIAVAAMGYYVVKRLRR